jgi:hypothetical protein
MRRHSIKLLIILLILLPGICFGFRLRQVATIPIEKDDRIFGHSSGNLIICNNNEITFLDRFWKVKSEMKLDSSQTAVITDNGLFFGIVNEGYGQGLDTTSQTATIYNYREQPIWSVHSLVDGSYFLSPSGEYLVAIVGTIGRFDYKLYMYHMDRPETEIDIESFKSIQFSDNGEFFLVNAGAKGIKLFNAAGDFIAQYDTQKMLAFSENGNRFCAYNHKGVLKIFEREKEKLNVTLNYLIPEGLKLIDEIERVFLIFSFKILAVNSKDGSILWQYSSGKDGGFFSSLDISPNNRFVACGIDINRGALVERSKRHVIGYLYVFDIDGQSLEEIKFKYDLHSRDLPDVKFLSDNRTIVVRNAEKLHFVEIY